MFRKINKMQGLGITVWVGLFAVAVLASNPLPSMAQAGSGAISGTVRDTTNAVIPGAEITIRNVNTGLARTLSTNELGRYLAPNLDVGDYEVQAQTQGFQTALRKGITLTVGREAVVDFTLSLGQVAESVTVTGEAPLVETSNATMAGLIDRKQMSELPLNGRNFDQLVLLEAGVQQNTTHDPSAFGGRSTRFSVAGARPEGQAVLLDGANIQGFWNQGAGNTITGTTLGVDSIREFATMTNTYGAEFSGGGAVVNAVTRSGTNSVHGTVFEFLRNDNFDARNFFDRKDAPEFKRNQFGFSIGGPIKQNKTFFFGNYEGLREEQWITRPAIVPDENARRGLLPNPQSPGNFINVGVHPAIAPVLTLYPLPSPGERNFGNGTAQFIGVQPRPLGEDFVVVRVDHNISDTDSFFVRYNFDDAKLVDPYSNIEIPGFPETSEGRNQYVSLEEKNILSPTLLNVAHLNFVRTRPTVFNPSKEPALQFFKVAGRQIGRVGPGSGISAIGTDTRTPNQFVMNTFDVGDDVIYTFSNHSMKFGASVNRLQNNFFLDFNGGGTYSFSNLTNFLQNRATQFRGALPGADSHRGWRQTIFALYAQDSFRVSPKLTLSLGFRYEFTTNPAEVNGLVSVLKDPAKDTAFSIVEHPYKSNPTLKNFAPRFGFAWDPLGNQKLAIRGGFGIYYNTIVPRTYAHGLNPPFYPQGFSTQPTFPDPLVGLGAVPRPSVTNTVDFSGASVATPHMLQYNLNIEREILPYTVLTAGYVGSRGINLYFAQEVNAVVGQIVNGVKVRPTPAADDSNRVNPNFSRMVFLFPFANSWYNSLQLSLKKRLSHGAQFSVAYTFSKSIDEASRTFGNEQANDSAQLLDPDGDRATDRGLSNFDVRHNITTNVLYALPSGPTPLLEGWQLSAILTLRSATPFVVGNSFDQANTGNTGSDRPNLRPGTSNNPYLGKPEKWFSTDPFVLQPAGTLGNLGRNTLQGPSLASFDFSLLKNTYIHRIYEEFNIQFRAEIFNLLNHANFATPSRTVFTGRDGIPNPSAGVVSSVATSARQIQFGLRVVF